MGVGFSIIYDKIANWIEMRRPSPYSNLHQKVFLVLLIILLASVLPKTLKSVRSEKIGRREAGLWIKGDMKSKPTIITTMPRVVYYAQGKLIYVPEHSLPNLSKIVEEKGFDYLVLNEKDSMALGNGFFNMIESTGWRRAHGVDGCGKIFIFKRY